MQPAFLKNARPDGSTKHGNARLVDISDVRANDWLSVNRFTVIEGQPNRRPAIVVFVNGLRVVLEALAGDPKRIALIATDLVAHFEKRTEAMDGKAMVGCMSRRICLPRGPVRSRCARAEGRLHRMI